MSKDPNIDDDLTAEEREMFRQAMRGVQKQPEPDTQLPITKKLKAQRREQQAPTEPAPTLALSHHIYTENVTAEEYLSYQQSGLQQKAIRQLKRGQHHFEAILDLHSYTQVEAHDALLDFIQYCSANGCRYVMVIHGKSLHTPQKPVLKNAINCWLRQLPTVLAFCSAQPKDGGTGALYVLLRRHINR